MEHPSPEEPTETENDNVHDLFEEPDDDADDDVAERPQKRIRNDEADKEATSPTPPPPKAPIDDIGDTAFDSFGFPFVVGLGIEATVEHKSTDSKMVLSVTLEITNEQEVNRESKSRTFDIKRAWFAHATDWPTRNRAVFKGACATSLAVIAQACHEVKYPGYAQTVLQAYFPSAVRNRFLNPYFGRLDAEKEKDSWHNRNNDIEALVTELNIRVARSCTTELSEMYENRRTQKQVFSRGNSWDQNVNYIANAFKTPDGAFSMEQALSTLYVYIVQIDAWSATLKGSKDRMRDAVSVLQGDFVDAVRQNFNV
jgi:hypothetical protein